MDSYSWIQKKFHKLVLSNQLVSEASHDIETYFNNRVSYKDNHVFVFGLARSGSTILLNEIHKSGDFASLCYSDMPFVMAPNLWAKISFNKKNSVPIERAHGDGIKISTNSPEAFEEVFWKTFINESRNEVTDRFKTFVSNVISKENKSRYLSKNNQNIKRYDLINEIFPFSKKLIPFRDPIQQSFSLLSQHNRFINLAQSNKFIGEYMKWTGHTEFGPNYKMNDSLSIKFQNVEDINHWLEQWYINYNSILQYGNIDNQTEFICYENLCMSSKSWSNIQDFLNIKKDNQFIFKESSKKITEIIDNKLLKKCNSLYTYLKMLSL